MALLRFTSFLIFFLFFPVHYQILAEESVSKVHFATENEMVTYSSQNGHFWKLVDKQGKIMYLIGIEEGMFLLMLQMNDDNLPQTFLTTTFQNSKNLIVSGFKASNLVDQVDIVYSDSANLRIPVIEAYRHIIKKFRGAKPEELANDLSMLRKRYNN